MTPSRKRIFFILGIVLAAIIAWKMFSPTPEKAEALNIRTEGVINSMNPLSTRSGYSRYAAMNVFQTLAQIDPKTMELKPLLITKIPTPRNITEGARAGQIAYDFEINPAAQWDNGSPITAKDVEFTLKLIANPYTELLIWSGYFEFMAGFEADKNEPRKFTVYQKHYYILGLETYCQVPIFPAYNYDPYNKMANVPLDSLLNKGSIDRLMAKDSTIKVFGKEFLNPRFVNDPKSITGSGAYLLEQMTDQQTTLVKKENWWGDRTDGQNPLLQAYPKRLVYKFLNNESEIATLLKNGGLDLVANLSPMMFMELSKDEQLTKDFSFDTISTLQYNRWVFNMRSDKLKEQKVRQALSYLVDYNYLITTVQQNMALRTIGPISSRKPYYNFGVEPYSFNVEKAKTLLAEAGWKDTNGNGIVDKSINGHTVELSLDLYGPMESKVTEMTANSVVGSAKQAGVEIKIGSKNLSELNKLMVSGSFETALFAAAPFPGLSELHQQYHSSQLPPEGDNRSALQNQELDRIIDAVRMEQDDAKRTELYKQAQAIIHDEAPEVFMYTTKHRIISSKKFKPVVSANRPGYYESLYQPN